jgi:Ring finger domain
MTVAQCISDGEASRQPDKWMTALTNALDYLQRLGGEDDVEDDEAEGPSEEQAARARRRQLRRARAALLTGRGGDEADGVRGTAGLREAVMALRRMVNHPSLEGPSLSSRQQGGEAGSSKATVQQKSFAVMLDEAHAAVRELEEKLATIATAAKEAAKEKVGKKGSGRNASEAQYITQRLSAARKRLELLREAVAGQAGSVCPICLESPGEGDLTKGVLALPCLHPACQACLAEWMRESVYSGCPVCRQQVKNTVTLFAATQVVHRSNTATAALDAKAAEMAKAAAAATVSPDVLQHGAKLAWLLQDIAQRQAAGGSSFRCVVFSAWETVLAVAAKALRGRGITCAEGFAPPGMQPSAGRSHAAKEINKFKGGAITVLLLPLRGAAKSAAAGLNLQEASVAYLYDPSTSRALEEQAVARISRIGQTKQVTVVRMCLSQTLDEDVVLLQQKLGAGRGGAAADEFVSGEDLAMLFGISAMSHASTAAAAPAAMAHNGHNVGAGPSSAIMID